MKEQDNIYVKETSMKLSVFLELIEAKAKAASIFPFLIGLCFSWYHFKQIDMLPLK